MEQQMARLGLEVRMRREAVGLSMEDLCEQAGIGRSTLHRIENGIVDKPNPSTFANVLHVLGFTAADLAAFTPDDADPRWVKRLELAMAAGPAARDRAHAHFAAHAGDLVALRDGQVIQVSVVSGGDDALERASVSLAAGGWSVSRTL